MSTSRLLQVVYALIAIVGASLTMVRLRAGDWLDALWPLLITAFCVFRFFTISERK